MIDRCVHIGGRLGSRPCQSHSCAYVSLHTKETADGFKRTDPSLHYRLLSGSMSLGLQYGPYPEAAEPQLGQHPGKRFDVFVHLPQHPLPCFVELLQDEFVIATSTRALRRKISRSSNRVLSKLGTCTTSWLASCHGMVSSGKNTILSRLGRHR